MDVGILGGTGPLGRGLAARLAATGLEVAVGSRDPERADSVAAGVNALWAARGVVVRGVGNEQAVQADLVVLATPWEAAVATIEPVARLLEGKVVVSIANALVREGKEIHALIGPRGSVAETLQASLPGAFVAAAGHHLPASSLGNPLQDLDADVLVCSDHAAASAATMELFARVEGLRPLDAGSLASASAIEAFTAVLITVNRRYRAHSTLKLTGLDTA